MTERSSSLSTAGDRPTVGEITRWAINELRNAAEGESPGREAQLLIGHVLGLPRESLLAHPERLITAEQTTRIIDLIAARALDTPIAYLIGQRAFFDRTLIVSDAVLIPRPETELIVTTALAWAKEQHLAGLLAIDVGTGSGAIAVTLAAHLPRYSPHARVIGVDVSIAALTIAQRNAIDLPMIQFIQADLLSAIGSKAAIIAANLPYIPTAEYRTLAVARYEPRLALDGGADGLDLIRRLVQTCPAQLAIPGILLIEHAADQGAAVQTLARSAFPGGHIVQLIDDAGLDRVVVVSQ